jgi:hypothetical protein
MLDKLFAESFLLVICKIKFFWLSSALDENSAVWYVALIVIDQLEFLYAWPRFDCITKGFEGDLNTLLGPLHTVKF